MFTPAPLPEDAQQPEAAAAALDELAAAAQERVMGALRGSRKRGDAERRKVLQRLGSEIQLFRRLLARAPGLTAETAARLRQVLQETTATDPTLEQAWYAADSLRLALLDVADDAYLGTLIEQEHIRGRSDKRLSWGRYLDAGHLEALYKASQAGTLLDQDRARAVEGLAYLFEKRRDDGAHYRARVELKAQAFFRAAAILGPLLLLAAVTTVLVSEATAAAVALTAAAGGLGSTLAGAKELRGMLRINDLRSLSVWSVLQPLVGASAGLVMLLLLVSGILGLPGVDGPASALAIALYGFLAGFSEPFFLGVVAKIAGTAEPADAPAAKT